MRSASGLRLVWGEGDLGCCDCCAQESSQEGGPLADHEGGSDEGSPYCGEGADEVGSSKN